MILTTFIKGMETLTNFFLTPEKKKKKKKAKPGKKQKTVRDEKNGQEKRGGGGGGGGVCLKTITYLSEYIQMERSEVAFKGS